MSAVDKLDADHAVSPGLDDVVADSGAVKARGYWELVFAPLPPRQARRREHRLHHLSVPDAFVGAPIAARLLHHGPNNIFQYGVDQNTLAPVGPWTHVPYPYPDINGHVHHTLLILGGDSQPGRDLFLRLLYGAQTSLEIAILATVGSVASASSWACLPATSAAGSTP